MEKELEKEFEKQGGIAKAKVGLVVCAVLVAILAFSNIWFYTALQSQTSPSDDLQAQIDTLENQLSLLDMTHQNYVSEHLYTNWEYELARFDFYYVFPAEQKFGVYDLADEVYGYEWITPYQEGVFDCSEMSAYLEWELENKGWNTLIIFGDSPFGDGYHAWILVETEQGGYMPVETTTMEIVWWDDPNFDNYFIYDYQFEDILDALDYYETEFDWWA